MSDAPLVLPAPSEDPADGPGARPLVPPVRGDRTPLPSGGWVVLRLLDDLKSRHRSHITAALDANVRAGQLTAGGRLAYAVAEVMVVDWHLPYMPDAVIPWKQQADPDTGTGSILEELSVRDENVLWKLLEPAMELLNPRDITVDDHKDPTSPTPPVGG